MTSRDRLKGAAAALAVQAMLGWLLVAGLATNWRHLPDEALSVFRVSPPPAPPPPPKIPPESRRSPRERRAPAPPNLRSTAADIVVPTPVIPPPVPPPVVAALTPSTGVQATSGAALTAGAGTGAGGRGDGTGGDGVGEGTGAGTPPRWQHGRLNDSDYPRAAGQQGSTGIVGVRYLVGTDGRVSECAVARSSGSRDLDDTTCRLIQKRFRFKPSHDASGQPVPAWVIESHEWVIDRPPPPSPSL